jgi:putative ABC transport system substrate-binding protein
MSEEARVMSGVGDSGRESGHGKIDAHDPLRSCASLDLRIAKCIFRESSFPVLIDVVPSLGEAMKRREFITLLGGATAWPLAARAQRPGEIARVGWLASSLDNPVQAVGHPALLSGLRKLGFIEGQNLILEHRRTDEGLVKAFAGANELAAAKADVLVADASEIALQAATAVRPPVPVVMLANNYDPLERGYIKSLRQPGGNITGLFYRQQELAAKQLELLAEAFPESKRVAVLWDAGSEASFRSAERAAKSMQFLLHPLRLENPPYDFDAAFRTMAEGQAQTVLVLSSFFFTTHRVRIAELAIQHRLPTMFIFKTYVEAGGLMSYGVDLVAMYQRAASYVAKILRGAQPADLPVEQANNFGFVLNLRTAKALGITLPTSILLRADEVIE